MKKKKYIALSLILSLLCINKTYAACTQEEINEFKKIENEYKVTYEFNKDTKDYNITIKIPYPDKYTYIIDENIYVGNPISEKEDGFTLGGIKPGKYTMQVISTNDECDDVLKDIILNLIAYNKYSEDPLCEGIEEFVLCQPTYDKEIDYDTFVSRVNTYKKTKEKKEEQTNEQINEEKQIEQYIKDNLIQIIIISIFIILVLITAIITAKTIRKSRRLE